MEALWFANTANSLLWWTYVKAFWRALNSVFGEKIKFKTTLKGKPAFQQLGTETFGTQLIHRIASCRAVYQKKEGQGIKNIPPQIHPLALKIIWQGSLRVHY